MYSSKVIHSGSELAAFVILREGAGEVAVLRGGNILALAAAVEAIKSTYRVDVQERVDIYLSGIMDMIWHYEGDGDMTFRTAEEARQSGKPISQ